MKYILPAVTILVLATGCTRGPKGLPVLQMPQRATQQATVAPVATPAQGTVQAPIRYSSVKPTDKVVSRTTKQTKKATHVTRKTRVHRLKPEPYSIGSGEKDPELLGPQTTINRGSKPSKTNKVVVPVMQEKDLVKSSKKIKSSQKIASVKKSTISKKVVTKKKPATTAKVASKKESMPTIDKVIKSSKTVAKKTEETKPVKQVSKKLDKAPAKKAQSAMSKAECLKMIGESKFTDYVSRFGGESGAIKRCEILKKLKG